VHFLLISCGAILYAKATGQKTFTLDIPQQHVSGFGEIGKTRQLNEKKWYEEVRDLGFYEMRWILNNSCSSNVL
jgi:hypothetical protein